MHFGTSRKHNSPRTLTTRMAPRVSMDECTSQSCDFTCNAARVAETEGRGDLPGNFPAESVGTDLPSNSPRHPFPFLQPVRSAGKCLGEKSPAREARRGIYWGKYVFLHENIRKSARAARRENFSGDFEHFQENIGKPPDSRWCRNGGGMTYLTIFRRGPEF